MTSESGDERERQRSPGITSQEEAHQSHQSHQSHSQSSGNKTRRSIFRKRLAKVSTCLGKKKPHTLSPLTVEILVLHKKM